MNHDIAKGEFGIVSIHHPTEGSSSSSRMLTHQYTFEHKRHDPHQKELDLGPDTRNMIAVTELKKVDDEESLELAMTVNTTRNVTVKNKTERENADIHFFLQRFMPDWKEALIMLFRSLPAEKREVEAHISYQDIQARKKEGRSLEHTNTSVMGNSADEVFKNFMKKQPLKLTKEQMDMIAPNWCHIIMSYAVTSKIAQSKNNLCCASTGLNIAMQVPESMVGHLAEHLKQTQQRVHVNVKLALVAGTSILKSMEYKITTEHIEIETKYDHPFPQPHNHFANQGVAHLKDVMNAKPRKR